MTNTQQFEPDFNPGSQHLQGSVNRAQIEALAYRLWQARGGEGGSALEDWRRAEQILRTGSMDDESSQAVA